MTPDPTYNPKALQEARADAAKTAAAVDKSLDYQPAVDLFSLHVWQGKLDGILAASETGGVMFQMGLLTLQAVTVDEDGFLVRLLVQGDTKLEASIVGRFEDTTMYLFKSGMTADDFASTIDQLIARFPKDKRLANAMATYPSDLTGVSSS